MDYVVGFFTSKLFMANCVICIIMLETGLRAVQPLYPKKSGDKERDEKYKAFRRNDLHLIYRPVLYLFAPFMLIRWIGGIAAWSFCAIMTKIIMIGQKKDTPLTGLRNTLMVANVRLCAKINMVLLGCLFINIQNVFVDYSEYLGPEWTKEKAYWGKAGSTVVNHQSWIDILVNMYRQLPSHVAKAATTKIPFVGGVAEASGCLFFDRGSKDQRRDLLTQMAERQKLSEQGIYPPLIMNVEGGTTNGTSLIKFKKGAFVGLNSIQPVVIKYETALIDMEQCIVSLYSHILLASCNPYCSIKVKEMPTFKPNEYFWKNHQKEGEEQWETYARVIRHIMAIEGGFEESDLEVEDKFAYKELLNPKLKGKSSD